MRPSLALLLFCATLLAACQAPAMPGITEIVPTATPLQVPTLTTSPEPVASPTARPTVRPTATFIPSVTPTSQPIPPSPTPKSTTFEDVVALAAPNGEWIALGSVTLVGDDQFNYRFKVQSLVGPAAWERQIVDELGPAGLGYAIPASLQWSQDGLVVYWANRPVPDGCAPPTNASDLFQLDITTGQSTQLLTDVNSWAAVAPDESAVAYRQGADIVVLNLATHTERTVSFTPPLGNFTTIVWAPDSRSFVFGLAESGCADHPPATALYRVDAATLAVITLLEPGTQSFMPAEWLTLEALILTAPGGQRWQLNPTTLALTEAPAAPERGKSRLFYSPDGQWLAQGALFPADSANLPPQQRLIVKRLDGSVTWTPLDQPHPIGCCEVIPGVVAWAANGQAVYWGEQEAPDGCGYHFGTLNLHRLDLTTGQDTLLLPAVSFRLGVAPDQSAVVYSTPNGLVLRDLATGAERPVVWPNQAQAFLIDIVWAPDSQSFVISSRSNDCSTGGVTNLYRVTASDLTGHTLLENNNQGWVPLDWPALNSLFLRDEAGARWRLNLDTGELTPAPAR